ncbi:MAG: hypothetical protein IT464_04110 [Planctomycetes bacterium]|nr:hypothetical protein [Planctomycetota bacterium]MCC7508543.1 hypothetical protein [Planctomycetota bacterium]
MKFHLHVGVVQCEDADTLEQVLASANCAGRVLARPAPNVAVLETEDAARLVEALNERGLHPKVLK